MQFSPFTDAAAICPPHAIRRCQGPYVRGSLLVLVGFCVFVPNLWGQDQPSSAMSVPEKFAQEGEEVRRFFNHLGSATRDSKLDEVIELYALEVFADRVITQSGVEIPPGTRAGLLQGLRTGMQRQLEFTSQMWARHKVSYLNFSRDGRLAEVIVRVWAQDGTSTRMLFELERIKSWRVVDWTDLTLGISTLEMTAAMLRDGLETRAPQDLTVSVKHMVEAVRALTQQDVDTASELLERTVGRRSPQAMETVRWCLTAASNTNFDPLYAYECVEKISAFDEDAFIIDYLRFLISLQLGQSDLVIEQANSFLRDFGPDAEAYFALGTAYLETGERELALASLEKGIRDTPESVELVEAIGLALPDDRKAELKEHFKAIPDAMLQFEYLADSFEVSQDPLALKMLLEAAGEFGGEVPHRQYYEGVVLVAEGDAKSAIEMLGKAMSSLDEDEADYLEWYQSLLCLAAIELGDPLAAYEFFEDKKACLRLLLEQVESMSYESEDESQSAEKADGWARRIIEHHQSEFELDAESYQFLAEREYYAGRHENEKAFLLKALELSELEDRRSILDDLLYCHFELDSEVEFYQSSSDADKQIIFEMFVQEFGSHGETYEQLEVLHRRSFPEDARFRTQQVMDDYQSGKFADALRLCEELVEGKRRDEIDIELQTAQIACLARTGKFDAAIVMARGSAEELRDYFRAIVYAIKGRKTLFQDAMERAIRNDGFLLEEVTAWTEIPASWQQELDRSAEESDVEDSSFRRYEDVRRVLFLLPRRLFIEAFTVRRAAESLGINLEEIHKDDLATDRRQYICELKSGTVMVSIGDSKLFITSGNKPYLGNADAFVDAAIPESDMADRARGHQAWLSIEAYCWPQSDLEQTSKIPNHLVKTMADLSKVLLGDSEAIAVHVDNWAATKCDPDFFEQLSDKRAAVFYHEVGESSLDEE